MAEQSYLGWIAAELGDVRADPFEAGDLVEQAVVAGAVAAFAAELGRGEEAERVHAIRNTDEHHSFLREVGAVIERGAGGTAHEAAAVDPGDHREFFVRCFRGGPNIEIQAILAIGSCGWLAGGSGVLHARGAE